MQFRSKIASDVNTYLGERRHISLGEGYTRFIKRQSAKAERRASKKDIETEVLNVIQVDNAVWDESWEVTTREEKNVVHRVAYFVVDSRRNASVFADDLVVVEQTFYHVR